MNEFTFKQNLKNMLLIEMKKNDWGQIFAGSPDDEATNSCGLNFYGEKMILGIQKTGSIHQSQMADVLKPPSAGRIN